MASPNRLAMTGSVFSLPLVALGTLLTFTGWVMKRLGREQPEPPEN